jgi:small subunit ribosomal protein S20
LFVKGSAAKRHRQSETARIRNKAQRSQVRSSVRRFLEAVKSGDQEAASAGFLTATKLIDTAAQKGVYHKNTAARAKSRLQKRLNALGA